MGECVKKPRAARLARASKAGAALCAFALSGCMSAGLDSFSSFGNSLAPQALPAGVEDYPDDEVLAVAKLRFREGAYGKAARHFERAVEVEPGNGEAWLGLGAAYDRVRRFDLADRAYRQAAGLVGERPEFFNNVGYSYLLRGDVAQARASFLRARELAPTNVTVNNNLDLLHAALREQRKN